MWSAGKAAWSHRNFAKTVKLSVIIPARNEEACLKSTVLEYTRTLLREKIPYEIVIVNDGSIDTTGECIDRLAAADPNVVRVNNSYRNGFGAAVRAGLAHATGDAMAIVMADASDSPEDLVRYYRKLLEGYDCVFGSRFIPGARVVDYPWHKLALNRLANWFILTLFGFRFNDTTNAFKCYRRHVVEGLQPLISAHFNLTVEMPLKAIVRGYTFAVIPISWVNRKTGISKLKIKEMGSRYLFIVLYLWLEKHLARGDYHRDKAVDTQVGVHRV